MTATQEAVPPGLLDELLAELETPAAKARTTGPDPKISVYLENLGWAQLFGYDMNRYYDEPPFQLEMNLRHKLYHLRTFADDNPVGSGMEATVGMYWDFTLLGMAVRHQPDGVPIIQDDHPMRRDPDLRLLPRHDFATSGEMPRLFSHYEELKRLTQDRVPISFPTWQRGPLDMAMQLRGYEQLVSDMSERPQFVHDLLRFLVEQRMHWWDAYCERFGVTTRHAGIADDWINVPFISPAIFRDFLLPRYLELEEYHEKIWGLHSCGDQVPVQHLMLQLKTLGGFEVNPWTDLEATLRNVPADKFLGVSIKNVDVLLFSDEEIEQQLGRIRRLCTGRSYNVTAQALQRVHADIHDDMRRTQHWIEVARRVLQG